MPEAKSPVALIILDGFGCRDEVSGNAVAQANKPVFDKLWNTYPHSYLKASGEAVGLPEGQMGNSEVGHLNIGAGRIVYQNLTRINKSIRDRDFFENEAFLSAVKHAKDNGSALHLMGLLSDGGVHSHYNHLFALLELAAQQGLQEVYVHGFLDGRDVGPKTALRYVEETEQVMKKVGVGRFASISGRYYAMDRDLRWDRVEQAYNAMTGGPGEQAPSATAGILYSYDLGVMDEFVVPFKVVEEDQPAGAVKDDDAVIFFNFRPDRAIQLSGALTLPEFNGFDRKLLNNLSFTGFTHYSSELDMSIAFGKENLENTLGEVLAAQNLRQLRIAETEKYPHVTFFMSGGQEEKYPGEGRILINSPKVATYDLQPEMSAYEVTDALVKEIEADNYDAVILNFANPDMVGHSGLLEPTIKAVETVDECLGRIIDALHAKGGSAIVTADHGNADEVVTMDGQPMTAHTTNLVPVIVTKNGVTLHEGGILADLAPTMLKLAGVEQPAEMTGKSLF